MEATPRRKSGSVWNTERTIPVVFSIIPERKEREPMYTDGYRRTRTYEEKSKELLAEK